MSNSTFNEPHLALNRIYTKTGDAGETRLVGGQKVPKDDLRIECYGTVDELNSFIGLARTSLEAFTAAAVPLAHLAGILKRVQHELFNLGSILATVPKDVHPKQPRITSVEVEQLEKEIDEANEHLDPLNSFVLPGGSRVDAELHVCRTVCRRAERLLVALSHDTPLPDQTLQYLNRLSDAFFVWSRLVNNVMHTSETLWQPNASASGHTTGTE